MNSPKKQSITHSLTPIIRTPRLEEYSVIPEIRQERTTKYKARRNSFSNRLQGTRKYRMI